ncbi:MAG: alpha-amylase, partial [Oscillatoriales cyanobacterium RU_3_3]|nr:alpha-amylase [Oscillatoriales cyanobacterium RU_3_3]
FRATNAFAAQPMPENPSVRPLAVEQSNSSILIDDYAVLKFYRRLAGGTHPDLEVGRFLTETAGFANTPSLLGAVELRDSEGGVAIAAVHAFIRNQGDGWSQHPGLSRALSRRRGGVAGSAPSDGDRLPY